MDAPINNVTDLRFEIVRLKQICEAQELVIKQHFDSPRAILGTITSLFKKNTVAGEAPESVLSEGKDIIGWLSELIIPNTLEKAFFRKSNFVIKALVRLASQKAAKYVNNESVGTLLDKVKSALPASVVEKISPKKPNAFVNLLLRRKQKRYKTTSAVL